MLTQVILYVLVVSSLQFLRCDGSIVELQTPRLTVSGNRINVTVICMVDERHTGCQFSWWDTDADRSGPVLDRNSGLYSQADRALLSDSLLGYTYTELGDCGVELQLKGNMNWMLSCRVRGRSSWATRYAVGWLHMPHTTTTASEVVALPGGEARFNLSTEYPPRSCQWFLPGGRGLHLNVGAASDDSTGRGRGGGDCGLTLSKLTEKDSGLVQGFVDGFRKTLFPLIVAVPPTPPTLHVNYNESVATAICSVPESHPVANITWLLGERVLREDNYDDSPGSDQDVWRWPWMGGSTSQSVTLILGPQNTGKTLTCSVSHVALAEPLVASEVVSITGAAH